MRAVGDRVQLGDKVYQRISTGYAAFLCSDSVHLDRVSVRDQTHSRGEAVRAIFSSEPSVFDVIQELR